MRKDTLDPNGTIWLGDVSDPGGALEQLEGDDTVICVERTDEDEVAIHATMPGDNNALVTLYVTRAQAALLAAQLSRLAVE